MPKSAGGVRGSHGRKVSGYRGIGSGGDSYKTSTGNPGKLSGYKKTGGDGMGGNKKSYSGGKGRMTGKKY